MDRLDLVQRVLARDPRGIARALRVVDDRLPGGDELMKDLWPHTGRAWVLGVTGNPGAGKSTMCDRLITAYRQRHDRVGVVAVDPTSPYSGGAILGDRIRMQRHANDADVFIRSVATRGHLGGLSRSARDIVRVLDAAAYGVILVETVGVGQDEIEITRTAHSTLVVMTPGLGDEIQAIKAGLLECADVFAVNKSDRDGADATVHDLELMISLGNEALQSLPKGVGGVAHAASAGPVRPRSVPSDDETWTPPIVRCIATRGDGVDEVVRALGRHRGWLEGTVAGRNRRRSRLDEELRQALREALLEAAIHDLGDRIDDAVRDVENRGVDPYTATERLVNAFRAIG